MVISMSTDGIVRSLIAVFETYLTMNPLRKATDRDDEMSGGHFDYADSRLYEWSAKVRRDGNPLLADLLHDIGDLLHEYDWWQSGDTGREEWLGAWNGWQEKWMKGYVKEMAIDSVRDAFRQMIWGCLGIPADEEYERIDGKMRGW